MRRLHVHTRVEELEPAVAFYTGLFDAPPAVRKDDYAKWMLGDPRVNFAISTRGGGRGVDHLGLQFETAGEVEAFAGTLAARGVEGRPRKNATCCYAKSDKVWLADPAGVAWEIFATHGTSETYGEDDIDLAEPRAARPATGGASKSCC